MSDDQSNAAGMTVPPPLAYGGVLAVGLLIGRAIPRPFLPKRIARIFGLVLVAAGLGLGFPTFILMRRAGTGIAPSDPSTTIVDGGPFRISRNPIYVSFTLLYLGITSLANSFWALALLPIPLVLIRKQVVEREEPYLERKFGEDYLRYKDRVGRWI